MPRGVKKTCIPGLFCIENMTMFLLFVLLITVVYMYYSHIIKPSLEKTSSTSFSQPIVVVPPQNKDVATPNLVPIPTRTTNPLTDVNAPPLKNENEGFMLPININTRGPELNYTQMGILTRENSKDDMILPLMGRRSSTGRDKYQYYTMSNSAGNINTKLPVSLKGKSCTSDLGCDEIFNGDSVYVEGYNDTFRATIYENALYKYIPL
jgi:hypothetical protein|tara:strand:+ start:14168 stop:14791 length:624 start_codon:yes stop_codon:yes gene_type:complete